MTPDSGGELEVHRRLLSWISIFSFAVLAVLIILMIWPFVMRTGKNASETPEDNEFLLEHRPVEVSFLVAQKRIWLDDTAEVSLKLTAFNPPDASHLGDEYDGVLGAQLTAIDCRVAPQKAESFTTDRDVGEFSWTWIVSDCSSGDKDIMAELDFYPNETTNIDSNKVPYLGIRHIRVVKALSLEDWKTVASIASIVVGIVAAAATSIGKRRTPIGGENGGR